jgi:hypothetical protein
MGTYATDPFYALTHGDDLDIIAQGDRDAAMQAVRLILAQGALAFDGALDVPSGEIVADDPDAGTDGAVRAAGVDGAMDLPGAALDFAGQFARGVLHVEQASQASALGLGKFD